MLTLSLSRIALALVLLLCSHATRNPIEFVSWQGKTSDSSTDLVRIELSQSYTSLRRQLTFEFNESTSLGPVSLQEAARNNNDILKQFACSFNNGSWQACAGQATGGKAVYVIPQAHPACAWLIPFLCFKGCIDLDATRREPHVLQPSLGFCSS
jgi:hypothetical protein